MRTSRRPHDLPDPGDNNPVDRQRRHDKIDGLDAGMNTFSATPQSLASNTLMDGAAGQLGSLPQMDYTMNGPDDPENEEGEE